MAQKVLFEIEVDAKFGELKKLQTEMDRLQKQQKESAKAGQKDTARYQSNKIALKELGAQHRAVAKEVKINRTATKNLGTSYNALTEQNRKLSQTLRSIKDPLGKNKKLFDQTASAIDKNTNKLKQMDSAMGRQQRNVGNYGSALGGLGKSFLSSAAGALGLVGGVQLAFSAIGGAVKTIREFEQGNANLASVLGTTKDGVKALADDAKRLGAVTSFSATQVTQLQTEFAKLGFNEGQILNATEATLDLAAATGTELGEAAAVAGATLGGFGLKASETQRIADVMAKSFSTSALDMEKFKESMKSAAPAAKAVGVSVEETTALLGTLANAGISGSKAGNNLKTSFINLNAAGLTLDEGLEQVANSQDKLGTATKLVGKNAAASFLVLAEGRDKTDELTLAYQDAEGAAAAMAATQLDTLDGALKILSSSYEGLILSMEDGNGVMSNIAKIIVQDVSGALSLLSGNLSAVDEKFSYLSIIITQIKIQFKLVTSVIKLVTLPLQLLWKVAVKVAEKLGLVSESASGIKETLLNMQQVIVRLPAIMDIVVEEISQSFLRLADIFTQIGRGFKALFSGDFATVKAAGKSIADIFSKGFNDIATDIPKRIEALWGKSETKTAEEEAEIAGERIGQALKEGIKKEIATINDFIKKSIEEDSKLKKLEVTLDIKPNVDDETTFAFEEAANKQLKKAAEDVKAEGEAEQAAKIALQKQIGGELIKIAQQTSDAIFSIKAQQLERQKDFALDQLMLQDTLERGVLESRLESGAISQQEYENEIIAQKERTAQSIEKIERAAFEKKKRLDTLQALINGAVGTTTTFAQLGFTPPGIIAAAALGVSTGIQVATIQSQQFAEGGMIEGGSHDQGGVPFTVDGKGGFEAEGGEAIINKKSVSLYGAELDYINRAGGGKSLFEKGGYIKKFANGGLVSQGGMSANDLTKQAEMMAQQINNIKVVNVATETQAVNNNAIKIENEFTL